MCACPQLEALKAEASEATEAAEVVAAQLAELRQRETRLSNDTQALVVAANKTQAQVCVCCAVLSWCRC